MMRRNGGMAKVVVSIIAFFGLVYFIYLYNDLSGQLKNTERSAERYRREQESVSAQLQDQIIAKDELKQRCDNDREQMTNRLNSQQQQYKMLKSQHEDMETEFGRLQNEKEKENEEHKKQDEERGIEYNQFKQEKSLEIASLKDSVANLEREKEQLSQQMMELKSQLQGSLDLVQQAHARQQQMEQQYQQLQQQQQQQQQQQIGGQQGGNLQGIGQQQGANLQGAGQQQGMNMQAGNQQGANMQFGGAGLNQQQQQQPQLGGGFVGQGVNQAQGGFQGLQPNIPRKDNVLGNLIHGGVGGLNPNVIEQQQVGNVVQKLPDANENFNIADDIMKSLQDKHKPVDADLLEEQQKQHQIIPPGDHSIDKHVDTDQAALGHQKHGQSMLGQDGHGIQHEQEQHQIGKPNLDHEADAKADHPGYKDFDANAHVGGDGNHDNRIENQGPVNLQVQEPNLHGEPNKKEELDFRPHIPVPDNQIQPLHVDDSQRQEQLDIPLGKDINQRDNRIEKLANEDDDDDKAHLPVLNAGRV